MGDKDNLNCGSINFIALNLKSRKLFQHTGITLQLEDIVYNDLIRKDYKVYIGKAKKGEIDFVTIKSKITKFIQVCYDLGNEETRNREVSAFSKIENAENIL